MHERKVPTEEQLDYLKEIMNIGAGNAARALSQLLHCNVDMNIPVVHLFPSAAELAAILAEINGAITCVRMRMLGDIIGQIFFFVSEEDQKNLQGFLQKTLPKELTRQVRLDKTLFEEIANITSGVFLTALHDFTRLSICHSVPVLRAEETISEIFDECADLGEDGTVAIIESRLTILQADVKAVLFFFPVFESLDKLLASIDKAREWMGAA